jgi:citrate lyase subunit beta/citryl-CoA lyase
MDGHPAPRSRRTVLAVPGSSAKMIDKARTLDADAFFLDLEDACAPSAKAAARASVVAALTAGGWGQRVRTVRVNDVTTEWAYRDVIEVVEQAGEYVDALVLPKVQAAADVRWLDTLLTQVEKAVGLDVGRIGIEAQIEDARGVLTVDEIAAASPRLQTLVFGPGDFIASTGLRTLAIGEQPAGYAADAYHYVLMRILMAARAHDLQAIDGPYPQLRDAEGLRSVAARSAALGFDGKWVIHPGQLETVNAAFTPRQDDYDRAETVLDVYARHTAEGRGAASLDGEMIDEATRKMALRVAGAGRAAGLRRTPKSDA